MTTGAVRSYKSIKSPARRKEVRFAVPYPHGPVFPESLLPTLLSPRSVWGPDTLIMRPYCRSGWRVFFALAVATCLFLPLYNQTRLRERFYHQYVNGGVAGARRYLGGMVFNNTLYRAGNERELHREWNYERTCRGMPDMDGILLVMKTGASEAFEKLPTQLLTSLQCLPDFLLFSDMVGRV
jgi:hypothetical protein